MSGRVRCKSIEADGLHAIILSETIGLTNHLRTDYLHINVIPKGNEELRKEISTYTQGLKDVSKLIVIDPKQLMCPIKDTHLDLYNYLDARYWQ